MTMRFLSLEVSHFGCVRSAKVGFAPGLNVLFGPNDLGKSTLAQAMRAVLLLQHTSGIARQFTPWDSDETPQVAITFQTEEQRIWRVKKRFGKGARGASTFESSRDGTTFTTEAKAREVDGRIRSLLGWGVASPGGKSAPRGLPRSFLSTLLLGEQADVVGIFNQTLQADTDESGKRKLTAALQAFAQDPLFKFILDQAQAKNDEAYTAKGVRKRGRTSPFALIADEVNQAKKSLEGLRRQLVETEEAELRVQELAEKRPELEEAVAKAKEHRQEIEEVERRWVLGASIKEKLDQATSVLTQNRAIVESVNAGQQRLSEIRLELKNAGDVVVGKEQKANLANGAHRDAEALLRRLSSAESAQTRTIEKQKLENEKLSLEAEEAQLSLSLKGLQKAIKAQAEWEGAQAAVEHTNTRLDEVKKAHDNAGLAAEDAKIRREMLTIVGLLLKR
ncbi:MAG: AAA family ATPase, partial [Proteobacteria bacterium]|nr:AAA family ATPase [Pseudomonadota bacterium]